MPPAGWYDDPLTPGGKRYWDGAAWTEAVQGPARGVPGTPGISATGGPPLAPRVSGGRPVRPAVSGGRPDGPAVFEGPPFEQLPPGSSSTTDRLNDISDWLNRTFRVLWDRPVPLLILFFAVPLPFWAGAVLAAHRMVAAMTWRSDTDELVGLSQPLLAVTIGLSLLAGLAGFVALLAGHHQLHRAHAGSPVPWTESLRVGLVRQPRFLVLTMVVYWLMALVVVVPIASVVALLVWSPDLVPLYAPAALLLFGAALLFVAWFWVKVAFLPVSAAVVAPGRSALAASWAVSRGRFWPVLGRLAIAFALATTISTVTQIVVQGSAPGVLLSEIEFGPGDELYVDGRPLDSIDVLDLGDVLPNPVGLLAYLALVAAIATVSQVATASAVTALYVDAEATSQA